MKIKRFAAAAAALVLLGGVFSGCSQWTTTPLTVGVSADLAENAEFCRGLELAVAELNENDGIGGTSVQLSYDLSGATVVIGDSGSEVFSLLPYSEDESDIEGKNAARLIAARADYGIAAANYIQRHASSSSIAIAYAADEESSHWAETFLERAAELELDVTAAISYTELTDDISDDICSTGANLVVLMMPVADGAALLSYADEHHRTDVSFLALPDFSELPELLEESDCINNVTVLTLYLANSGNSEAFDASYTLTYGDTPTYDAVLGYDSLYLLSRALQEQTGAGDFTAEQLAELLTEAFSEDSVYSCVTGAALYANGNPTKDFVGMYYDGEAWQPA